MLVISLKKLFSSTYSRVRNHIHYLLEGFFPIAHSSEDVERIRYRKYGKQYIAPLLLMIYIVLESLFIIFTIGYNPHEPYIYNHAAMNFLPVFFIKQGDIILGVAFVMAIFVYFQLIFETMPHIDFIMFPVNDNSDILCSNNEKGNNY